MRSSSRRRRNSYSCSWKSSITPPTRRETPILRPGSSPAQCLGVVKSRERGRSVHHRRRMAPLRAPCAHDGVGRRTVAGAARGPLPPRRLRRPRDHRPLEDRRRRGDGLLVVPSVELNCVLPGARDGHVLGFGVGRHARRAARARGRLFEPGRDGRVDHGARRSRVPRAPVLDRRDAGHARASGERDRDRGLQRGLRARGRARALGGPLGRAARGRPPLPGARDGRLASSGIRLGLRLDVAARRPSGRATVCSPRCATARSTPRRGPSDPRRAAHRRRRSRCGAARAVRSRSSPGKTMGAAVNAGRLGYRHKAEVTEVSDDGLDRRRRPHDPARCQPRARPGHGRGRAGPRGAVRFRHEAASEPSPSSASVEFDLLVDRRRDHRRGHRRAARAIGLAGCARRSRATSAGRRRARRRS